MSPEIEITAKEVRSRYAYLFSTLAELCRLRYGERPATDFPTVHKETSRLKDDGYLSDYLSENLSQLYSLYPEMLPGKRHGQKWLSGLFDLLGPVVGDLCAEIKDLVDEGGPTTGRCSGRA